MICENSKSNLINSTDIVMPLNARNHSDWSYLEISMAAIDVTFLVSKKGASNEPICKAETDSQTWRTGLLPGERCKEVGWMGSLGLVDANCYI